MIIKRQGKVVDTEKAIELSLGRVSHHSRGEAEQALEISQQCAQAIAVLVASLAGRELLTKSDVQQILSSEYEVMK